MPELALEPKAKETELSDEEAARIEHLLEEIENLLRGSLKLNGINSPRRFFTSTPIGLYIEENLGQFQEERKQELEEKVLKNLESLEVQVRPELEPGDKLDLTSEESLFVIFSKHIDEKSQKLTFNRQLNATLKQIFGLGIYTVSDLSNTNESRIRSRLSTVRQIIDMDYVIDWLKAILASHSKSFAPETDAAAA